MRVRPLPTPSRGHLSRRETDRPAADRSTRATRRRACCDAPPARRPPLPIATTSSRPADAARARRLPGGQRHARHPGALSGRRRRGDDRPRIEVDPAQARGLPTLARLSPPGQEARRRARRSPSARRPTRSTPTAWSSGEAARSCCASPSPAPRSTRRWSVTARCRCRPTSPHRAPSRRATPTTTRRCSPPGPAPWRRRPPACTSRRTWSPPSRRAASPSIA